MGEKPDLLLLEISEMGDEIKMNNNALEPCPFCGSQHLEEDWDFVTTIYGVDHQSCWVNCNGCNLSILVQCKEENGEKMRGCLIRIWNTRAAIQLPQAEVCERIAALRKHSFANPQFVSEKAVMKDVHTVQGFNQAIDAVLEVLNGK